MAEYIEREALLKEIDAYFDRTDPSGEEQIGVLQCRRIVREIPAADVVEVVRCKDCSYGENDSEVDSWYLCRHQGCDWNYGNHFCSYGERRADNGAD